MNTEVKKVEKAVNNKKMTNGNGKSDHSEVTTPVEKTPEPQPQPQQQQQQQQQPVVPMPNAAAQPIFPPPPTMAVVPPTTQQPSINFLQESQIGKLFCLNNQNLVKSKVVAT